MHTDVKNSSKTIPKNEVFFHLFDEIVIDLEPLHQVLFLVWKNKLDLCCIK